MKDILRVEHGSFAYRNGPQILKDINFEVKPGEILAVLGPNGAGKTTLLRCMMDMLRWSSGRSLLDGEDIHSMPARKLWSRMAYVPQAKSAASSYTAFQTVLLGRSSRIGTFSAPSDKDMEITERVMKQLGIMDLADKQCYAVSGGELQMILIARAMASEPKILVLDEPESNLDFKNQLVVLDTISSLASDGVACVFNTHYPAHALQRAGKSLILAKGGNCMFGSTTEVVTEDNIRKAFGVNAVIGEIETRENILKNVMPLSIVESGKAAGPEDSAIDADNSGSGENSIATISIIMQDNKTADKVNRLLHEYNHLVIGRMGLPHRSSGLHIINLTLDGAGSEIGALSHRLSLIPGISVKTTYAK
ncbi:MAG: ATP-binding cassette domain-containing protein [Mogibacterium sp.]|nr:ATP-binding cassette domain-containing protein [Mogibacterium sp.]